jgi:hypothetical protein
VNWTGYPVRGDGVSDHGLFAFTGGDEDCYEIDLRIGRIASLKAFHP